MLLISTLLMLIARGAAATTRIFSMNPSDHPLEPIRASPPSTLLPPGQTALQVMLSTATATTCKWDRKDIPYGAMTNSFNGSNTVHVATLTGLTGTLQTGQVLC